MSYLQMRGTRLINALNLLLAVSTFACASAFLRTPVTQGTKRYMKYESVLRTSPMFATQEDSKEPSFLSTKDVVSKVAVTGATGRTGRLVVEELMQRDVSVVALVRTLEKANEVFSASTLESSNLKVIECDLTQAEAVTEAVNGCEAAIWCATGFSDSQTSLLERVKRLLGFALAPQQSIDAAGLPILAKALKGTSPSSDYPKVVMLSSAGVTRPSWDESKKERLVGCADIPIVRLNPFGILDVKAESEERLRQSGTPYCVVRPTGLNDDWPAGCRPLVSQGDVAVGRINRKDVAQVLVDVLSTPEASGKTFEVLGLNGPSYVPSKDGLGPTLGRLQPDATPLTEAQVETNYHLLQQLLPGVTQKPAELAMGQTYEELDAGKEGRLGPRGTEQATTAAPQPTTATQ